MGSSPHSRGTLIIKNRSPTGIGIIPAFAGNTIVAEKYRFLIQDHPRIRGEHKALANYDAYEGGSSPHSRGTPSITTSVVYAFGIIPAFAGNTKA